MDLWNKIAAFGRREIYYYNTNLEFYPKVFAARLGEMIQEELESSGKREVLFLCIGTDRSTGDSLGPLIGYKLKERQVSGAKVLGTLDAPVHAMNLDQYLQLIQSRYSDYLVVAIDASVGSCDHIGYVTLGRGSLKPGLGVSKELKAVGDIFVTGIVGSCSNYDPLMLQSVRLSIVMRLADCISESICLVEKLWDSIVMV